MRTFKMQQKHGTESLRLVPEPRESELWMAWPAMVGFSFTAKCWGQVMVEDITTIHFRRDAFEQLVLPAETKEIIRSAVRHAGTSGLDFIEGKGDNTIFLLYGPPGCGKTLTAEAIAEMLQMPLYVVTAGDLGINASEVEQNLSQVLHLCSEWNALTLIDEADIFLEARNSSELQRNALVCVMLRLLEYHQGILFLTTNRASGIDAAVRSRITVALKYDPLNRDGREAVWRNLLQKIPHSSAEPSKLARHVLNGRQIKSSLLLANALAAERGEDLSGALIERAVAVVGEQISDTVEKPQITSKHEMASIVNRDVIEDVMPPQSSRRVFMPLLQATPQGRLVKEQPTITPRRVRDVSEPRASSPYRAGPAPTFLQTVVHAPGVPQSPRVIASTASTPSIPIAPRAQSQGKASRLWEPTASQRTSQFVLGHDANPFLQNGPAPSRIPPSSETAFADTAPRLAS